MPWGRNVVTWFANDHEFPMTHIIKAGTLGAIMRTVVGFAITAVAALNTLRTVLDRGFHWGYLIMASPFMLAGLVLLFAGINRFVARKAIVIRQDEVECDEVSLRGRKHWKLPSKKFEGVMKKWIAASGASKTLFQVVLQHKTPERSVVLFQSRSWLYVDKYWKHFATLLQLPAIEKTIDGRHRRLTPREIEQASPHKKVKPEILWLAPEQAALGKRARIQREGDGLVVSCPRTAEIRNGLVAFLLAGGLAALSHFVAKDDFRLAVPITGGVAAILLARLIVLWVSSEFLYVSPRGVEHRIKSPLGLRLKRQFPLELITNVQVKRNPRTPFLPASVTILAGNEAIRFAGSLSPSEKETLRSLVITALCQPESGIPAAA